MKDLRSALNKVTAGTAYTREHYWTDPSKFVGHVPAQEYAEGLDLLLAALPTLLDLAEWTVGYFDECRFDHHGYCQAHGLSLSPCPVGAVIDLLTIAAADSNPTVAAAPNRSQIGRAEADS